MKISVQGILDDLKAKSLPMAEEVAIKAIDSILDSLKSQADAQAPDLLAMGVSYGLNFAKPLVDQEMAKLLPDAAKA